MTTRKSRLKKPASLHFKELSDGRKSIYLDVRNNGVRKFRALRLYLLPETDIMAKRHNEETLRKAEALKDEAILEHTYARAGLEDRSYKAHVKLADWMLMYRDHLEKQGKSESAVRAAKRLNQEILDFDPDITLEEVDMDFVNNFTEYLRNRKAIHKTPTGKMCANTVHDRLCVVRSALNWARQQQIISRNPFNEARLSRMKEETHVDYLTVNEVTRMIDAYCPNATLKTMFLVACFTGFRFGDLAGLQWGNVVMDGERWRIELVQQKTKEFVSVPLCRMARHFLPKYKKSYSKNRKVFEPVCRMSIKRWLRAWTKDAQVSKNLTFHMSRHTFATLSIEAGIDIYTVYKLLGHRCMASTQVYSDVVDSRKESAVLSLDALNLLKDALD